MQRFVIGTVDGDGYPVRSACVVGYKHLEVTYWKLLFVDHTRGLHTNAASGFVGGQNTEGGVVDLAYNNPFTVR